MNVYVYVTPVSTNLTHFCGQSTYTVQAYVHATLLWTNFWLPILQLKSWPCAIVAVPFRHKTICTAVAVINDHAMAAIATETKLPNYDPDKSKGKLHNDGSHLIKQGNSKTNLKQLKTRLFMPIKVHGIIQKQNLMLPKIRIKTQNKSITSSLKEH